VQHLNCKYGCEIIAQCRLVCLSFGTEIRSRFLNVFQYAALICSLKAIAKLPDDQIINPDILEPSKKAYSVTHLQDNQVDKALFDTGLNKRKATLGAEYVEKNLAAADDFTRPFQEAMTEWCWGFGWGDETIDAKTRSMMNLSMIGALGKMHEWEIHCRGAINNGVSVEEIRAIIHVIAIYCGVPQSLECFRVARKVLEEQNLL